MDENFSCPYCGQPKKSDSAAEFMSCRFCGFKSAVVEADDGKLLVVDRRMPFLKKKCQELAERHPDTTVIVDRRIAQDPIIEQDRRIALQDTPT